MAVESMFSFFFNHTHSSPSRCLRFSPPLSAFLDPPPLPRPTHPIMIVKIKKRKKRVRIKNFTTVFHEEPDEDKATEDVEIIM